MVLRGQRPALQRIQAVDRATGKVLEGPLPASTALHSYREEYLGSKRVALIPKTSQEQWGIDLSTVVDNPRDVSCKQSLARGDCALHRIGPLVRLESFLVLILVPNDWILQSAVATGSLDRDVPSILHSNAIKGLDSIRGRPDFP